MDKQITLFVGDSRNMRQISDDSVNLVITSPPYYNLIDYGHPEQIGFGQTFAEFVKDIGQVLKECTRVFTSDGTICVNICTALQLSRLNNNQYYNLKYEIEKRMYDMQFYTHGVIIWNLYNENYIVDFVFPKDKYLSCYPVILHSYEYILNFKNEEYLGSKEGFLL